MLPASVVLKAQSGSYNLNFSLSASDFVDTVDISIASGRVIVPVEMNGRQYRFMFDTGAAQAIIYEDSNIEGCRSAGTILSLDAIGNRQSVPLVKLPTMTIGSVRFQGCQATLHQRPKGRHEFDGIIGFDLICKGVAMKIDVQNKRLVMTDRKNYFNSETGFESKYRVRSDCHTPYVEVSPFRGYREEVLFDTGSRNIYAINKRSFDKALPACNKQRPAQIEGRAIGSFAVGLHGQEKASEVVFLGIDCLIWGDFGFQRLETKTTQGGSHLGAGVLAYGSLTFLPHKKKVRFQPYKGGSNVLVGNEQEEKVIVNKDGKPVVAFVWPKSDAFKAGLREGDVILKADGHVFRTFDDFKRFRYLIGHVYTFVTRDRRGMNKEVKMKW